MTKDQGALASVGVSLSENGYEVIHVSYAKKGPTYKGWERIATDPNTVKRWIGEGKGQCNVGIRTKHTPAVDIDILDAELSAEINAWCQQNIGFAPTRVGRAPKQLLVYYAKRPFTKRVITVISPEKVKQKVEILGDGQQFIAYGVHEDTKKPYKWTSERQLTDLETWELSEISLNQVESLFDAVERMCKARGWTIAQRSGKDMQDNGDPQDLANYQLGTDFTDAELQGFLVHLDPDAGYERWLQVGQALHHHFSGNARGLELWDEWSQRSLEYNDRELRAKWKSFHENRSGKVITAKTLAHWAQEAIKKDAENAYAEILELIAACESVATVTDRALYEKIAARIVDENQVNLLANVIKDRTKALGSPMPIADIRKGLRKALKKQQGDKPLPAWCEDFVFVTQDDRFYDMANHNSISDKGFNAKFNRIVGGGGEDGLTATRFALDMLRLPTADSYTYLPNQGALVRKRGRTLVNTYDSSGVPVVPVVTTFEEDEAVERVQEHFRLMFPDERERELLISYFAYTVQELDSRVRWAPLIYGGEGTGKTFYSEMMRAVLGTSNLTPISARQLAQQFTGWAEGKKMVVFEEIRLSGQNRYEILDAVKPYITNDTVDVRRMRTDPYAIDNVTNYLLFTNHADALPLALGDRRYFVLSTSLLSKTAIDAFNDARPKYFTELFDAVKYHPGAILGWLQSYPLHPEFKPNNSAPATASKAQMREQSQDETYDALESFIASAPAWDISNELLCAKSLTDAAMAGVFNGQDVSVELPPPNRLRPLLTQLGFYSLGRARPGPPGPQGKGTTLQRYWSKTPEAVRAAGGLQEYVRLRMPADEDDLGLD